MTWNITMTQLLGSKGLTGYVNGDIPKPGVPSASTSTPDTTPIYSTKPNLLRKSAPDRIKLLGHGWGGDNPMGFSTKICT